MANGPRRRASSPMRRTALSGIPEASPPPPPARTITPGPNAFALRAAEVDAAPAHDDAGLQHAVGVLDPVGAAAPGLVVRLAALGHDALQALLLGGREQRVRVGVDG